MALWPTAGEAGFAARHRDAVLGRLDDVSLRWGSGFGVWRRVRCAGGVDCSSCGMGAAQAGLVGGVAVTGVAVGER